MEVRSYPLLRRRLASSRNLNVGALAVDVTISGRQLDASRGNGNSRLPGVLTSRVWPRANNWVPPHRTSTWNDKV